MNATKSLAKVASSSAAAIPKTQITVLENGLRVATQAARSHLAAAGLYVQAGQRYESREDLGVCRYLSGIAFKSNEAQTNEQVADQLAQLGGNIFCTGTRESIMYQGSVLAHQVSSAIELIANTALRPALTAEEIASVRNDVEFEKIEIAARPDIYCSEVLHAQAFGNTGLGNNMFCDSTKSLFIDRTLINSYRERFYRPSNMVVAGIGMEHAQLVDLAYKHFGHLQSFPNRADILSQPSQYVGGSKYKVIPKPPPTHTNTDIPLTHINVAFPSPSFTHPDVFPISTLLLLMGGGGSFSAGGPGKGMYSRLYTNVLNRYGWMESCAAFHHAYQDTSLFGIAASCSPKYHHSVLNVLIGELLHMSHQLTEEEINRAKNQLKSSLLMNLESQLVQLEDLGRQVLAQNKQIGPHELVRHINAVTRDDIVRVAAELTSGEPTCVAVGENVTGLPDVHGTLAAFRELKKQPYSAKTTLGRVKSFIGLSR